MPYVFAQALGTLTKGMVTGHSHPYFNRGIISSELYLWPEVNGSDNGQAIEPFYAKQIKAAREDEQLYEVLAVLNVIKTGKSR